MPLSCATCSSFHRRASGALCPVSCATPASPRLALLLSMMSLPSLMKPPCAWDSFCARQRYSCRRLLICRCLPHHVPSPRRRRGTHSQRTRLEQELSSCSGTPTARALHSRSQSHFSLNRTSRQKGFVCRHFDCAETSLLASSPSRCRNPSRPRLALRRGKSTARP